MSVTAHTESKPKLVSAEEIRRQATAAIEFMRSHHKSDPHLCMGYVWATLARMLQDCGEPYPISPWMTAALTDGLAVCKGSRCPEPHWCGPEKQCLWDRWNKSDEEKV